nr:hypothetical protein OH820_28705 [Streptomyces sp. NBC_00857]
MNKRYAYTTDLLTDVFLAAYKVGPRLRERAEMDPSRLVNHQVIRGWNEAKHLLGFRVFGVAIGAPRAAEAGSVLEALCDNLRSIDDLTDVHAAADLFRVI